MLWRMCVVLVVLGSNAFLMVFFVFLVKRTPHFPKEKDVKILFFTTHISAHGEFATSKGSNSCAPQAVFTLSAARSIVYCSDVKKSTVDFNVKFDADVKKMTARHALGWGDAPVDPVVSGDPGSLDTRNTPHTHAHTRTHTQTHANTARMCGSLR